MSLHTWHHQGPHKPSSCATFMLSSHWSRAAVVEIIPQLKPRGSVAKEEDTKPSHQLYKLQIKSTRSTRQTVCLWNI